MKEITLFDQEDTQAYMSQFAGPQYGGRTEREVLIAGFETSIQKWKSIRKALKEIASVCRSECGLCQSNHIVGTCPLNGNRRCLVGACVAEWKMVGIDMDKSLEDVSALLQLLADEFEQLNEVVSPYWVIPPVEYPEDEQEPYPQRWGGD